jgi:hypothetical protein
MPCVFARRRTNDEAKTWSIVIRLSSFVLCPLSFISPLNNRLGAFGKLAAWHQYLATAGEAAHPNVCAQPDHAPLVAAAWMYLAHSNYVVKPNVSGINHK